MKDYNICKKLFLILDEEWCWHDDNRFIPNIDESILIEIEKEIKEFYKIKQELIDTEESKWVYEYIGFKKE